MLFGRTKPINATKTDIISATVAAGMPKHDMVLVRLAADPSNASKCGKRRLSIAAQSRTRRPAVSLPLAGAR
jgi:hypothetical protein